MSEFYSDGPKPRAAKVKVLKPGDLVERMKMLNPGIVGKLGDKRLGAIVRSTLQALAAEMNERDRGSLRIAGLGSISIRQVEREKDGEVVQGKRVTLRPHVSKD